MYFINSRSHCCRYLEITWSSIYRLPYLFWRFFLFFFGILRRYLRNIVMTHQLKECIIFIKSNLFQIVFESHCTIVLAFIFPETLACFLKWYFDDFFQRLHLPHHEHWFSSLIFIWKKTIFFQLGYKFISLTYFECFWKCDNWFLVWYFIIIIGLFF